MTSEVGRQAMQKMVQLIPIGKLTMHSKPYFKSDTGFTYIGLLLFIAITSIGLLAVGITWQYQVRAENEQQLLFVGGQFRAALNSYITHSPTQTSPLSFNDLLLDSRSPNVRRHLRQIYTDPMTGKSDWGMVTQQGRIVGVYSKSTLKPIKHQGFSVADAKFSNAKTYQDWIFGQTDGIKSATPKSLK